MSTVKTYFGFDDLRAEFKVDIIVYYCVPKLTDAMSHYL